MDAGASTALGCRLSTPTDSAADPYRRADKQNSWDTYGAEYWAGAGDTSHPSALETENFLSGAGPGQRVLVLGATTTEVIQAALDCGAEAHVLDFAPRLLGLVQQRFGDKVATHHQDLTDPVDDQLLQRFDIVVGDRLVNRFHRNEMPGVLANMMSTVAIGGQLRISVRFGLYPLDSRLIEVGREMGTVTNFWDESSWTLNWSRVGEELDRCARDHGEIPRQVVIAWSRLRGVESRLREDDMPRLVAEAGGGASPWEIVEVLDMDVAPQSKTFVIARASARGDV